MKLKFHPKCNLVVIKSTARQNALSLRGYNNGSTSDIRSAISEGGFQAGDKVVLITEEHYTLLMKICAHAKKLIDIRDRYQETL